MHSMLSSSSYRFKRSSNKHEQNTNMERNEWAITEATKQKSIYQLDSIERYLFRLRLKFGGEVAPNALTSIRCNDFGRENYFCTHSLATGAKRAERFFVIVFFWSKIGFVLIPNRFQWPSSLQIVEINFYCNFHANDAWQLGLNYLVYNPYTTSTESTIKILFIFIYFSHFSHQIFSWDVIPLHSETKECATVCVRVSWERNVNSTELTMTVPSGGTFCPMRFDERMRSRERIDLS